MNTQKRILIPVFVLLLLASPALATQLGVNYYHESMVTERWGVPYINVDEAQVREDLDHIKGISSHIKVYMNPFVDANTPRIDFLVQETKNKGFHTVINMMVDDRNLESWNWGDYSNRVLNLCSRYDGKVDSILVGNEIILHSSMDKYEVRNRVESLINGCEDRFNGQVSYEAFWFEKEAWYDWNKPIYFMQYEQFDNFKTNVAEMHDRFGSNAYLGEWGEDSIDEGVEKDDWFQRVQIEKRWNEIAKTDTPVAYVFTYREPSWNGFGIIRPDGIERPAWDYLETLGGGSEVPTEDTSGETDGSSDSSSQDTSSTGIAELDAYCSTSSGSCTVKQDSTVGACRTVVFDTAASDIQIFACQKSGGYVEIYLQNSAGISFEACLDKGCVTQSNGFARFIPDGTSGGTQSSDQNEPSSSGDATSVANLQVSCEASGCSKVRDDFDGACRDVDHSTSYGTVKIQACDKSGDMAEIYVYEKPSNADFRICLGTGCVHDGQGFARISLSGQDTSQDDTTNEEPQGDYSVSTLPVSSTPSGNKVGDWTDGTCRTVQYDTSKGFIQAQICDKGSNYEMYQQTAGTQAQVCVLGECVGAGHGFASFDA